LRPHVRFRCRWLHQEVILRVATVDNCVENGLGSIHMAMS